MMWGRTRFIALAAMPAVVAAQSAIPVRQIGSVVASSVDSLRLPFVVRGMSDGSMLVNEYLRRRVVHFDPSLARMTVTVDSSGAQIGTSLIAFTGDSSLLVDLSSPALLVLDEKGKTARIIAPPITRDLTFVGYGLTYGMPGLDPGGRLIYRGALPPSAIGTSPLGPVVAQLLRPPADSAPLVRADFATRTVDTIGFVRIAVDMRTTSVVPGERNRLNQTLAYDPYASGDEWLLLRDGSIAIVRTRDYHVDWIGADGTRRSTPKMAMDWRRLTDAEKQARVDSARPMLDRANETARASGNAVQTPTGLRGLFRQYEFIAVSEMPEYVPPITRGSSYADADGNVWILPQTSVAANGGGLLYDVVNKNGQIAERVQLPKGRTLIGFARSGIAILMHVEGATARLERVNIR